MASNKIKGLTVEIGGDTTKLGKALDDVNKRSRDLSSELGEINKMLKLDPGNTELLAQKQKVLAEAISNTGKKLDTLKEAEKQVQAQFERGEVSEEQVRALQREIVATEKKLNGYEQAAKETAEQIENVGKKSKDAGDKTFDFGEKAKAVGSAAAAGFAAVATAAGAAVTALAGAAVSAAAYADEMLTTSTVTGMSTDDLQAFSYASELVDVSLDTLTKSMGKNIKSMSSAQQGSKAYAEAYKKLGISVTDSNGNLRDSETVYWESIDALGKMTNETERDALAMQLFGKSAQELNPLIEAGSEKMKELTQEAHDVGAVLSEDTLAALGEFDDSIQRLKGSAGAAKNALGGVLLPELQMLTDAGGGFLADFTRNLNTSGGGLEGFATTIGSMSGQIGGLLSDVATKLLDSVATIAPSLMQVAMSLATTLTTSLISMVPQLVTTGIQLFMSLLTGLTQAIPQITAALVGMIPQLVAALVTGIPQLIQGAVQFLLAIVQAIPQILPPLIAAIPQICLSIINGLLTAIPQLIQGALQFLLAIVRAIPQLVAQLVPQIPVIVTTVINGLLDNIPLLLDAAVTLLLAIVEAIPEICVELIRALPQIWSTMYGYLKGLPSKLWAILKTLVSKFVEFCTQSRQKAREGMAKVATAIIDVLKSLPGKLLNVGKDLVKGLWNGIKDMTGWVKDKISGFSKDVLNGIKNFFGIKSPSRVMRDQVGKMIAKGLAAGIDAGAPEVVKAMESLENDVIKQAESIMNSFGLFDFANILKEESDIDGSTLLNNLSSQVTALQTWTDEIEKLRGKIGGTDLFDALAGLGVKNLHEVQAINAMTAGQLEAYVLMYDQKQRMAASLAHSQAGGLVIEEAAKGAEKAGTGKAGGSSSSSNDKEVLSKLNGIYERLGRLKMVTDTGAFVGEIIDDIDAQLSGRQRLVARGVY